VSPAGAQLILTTAKLFFGALILAGGALGDVYGRKRMLLLGVSVVAVSSVLSAMAGSQGAMMAARALDGIGNAMVGPLALAILALQVSKASIAKITGVDRSTLDHFIRSRGLMQQ
jgi:MFS family permease